MLVSVSIHHNVISVPRACLARSFVLLIDSSFVSHNSTSSLKSILEIVSKYASVSTYFRSIILDVTCHFFNTCNFPLRIPENNSLVDLLNKTFPNSPFSIEYYFNQVFDFNSPLHLDSVRISRCQNYTEEPVTIDLFNQFFSLHSPLFVSNLSLTCKFDCLLFDSIISTLPVLTSMSITEYSSNDRGSRNGVSTFPQSLSQLSSLTVYSNGNLDISNMTSLNNLSCSCSWRCHVVVSGLASLSELQSLDLHCVGVDTGLHPNACLEVINLEEVSTQSLVLLFSNNDSIKNSSISIIHCEASIIDPVFWNISSNISTYVATYEGCLKLSNFPYIESLVITSTSNSELDLRECTRLCNLVMAPFQGKQISLTSPMTCLSCLSSLEYTMINTDGFDLLQLLKHCPYLQHLLVFHLNCDVYQFSLQLNYLKYLKLMDVTDFFTKFPCKIFPRLAFLRVVGVDLDIAFVTQKCPVLDVLEISDCQIENSFNEVNNSVRILRIAFFVGSPCEGSLNLRFFNCVSDMNIVIQDFQFKSLLLPPQIYSLHVVAPFSAIKDEFLTLPQLVSISGTWSVSKEQEEEAKLFVDNFSALHPFVCNNFQIQLINR
ncbi:hypothetical protein RCL1_006013 [Eukaryota sp. TZLM3-RCL]